MIKDPFSSFFCFLDVTLPGSDSGALPGLTFAAKDSFEVVGQRTGAGSPDWLRTHEPAERTAPAVQAILQAGARLVGKTRMDELAFSLEGRNAHYGTPVNPAAPDRIPGGSSSGSAVATAGGLVDFALGTDTAGSVRIPAHNCGIYGIRPTHGRIPLDGIAPFSPSFDTVGWFARDPSLLRRVGQVLLPPALTAPRPSELLIADDAFELADAEVRDALAQRVTLVSEVIGRNKHITLSANGPETWTRPFGVIRGAEVRASLGAWIDRVQPAFGPGIRERFESTRTITPPAVEAARSELQQFRCRLDELLDAGRILCLPTGPMLAPLRDDSAAVFEQYRTRTLALTCIASAAGVPQISLPVAEVRGCPIGLSLIGARGADERVLELVEEIGSCLKR
jgi:amidase